MDLSRCWKELLHDGLVDLQGGLRHDVSDGFDIFLKVLQLLVDHGAEDADDLRVLFTKKVSE